MYMCLNVCIFVVTFVLLRVYVCMLVLCMYVRKEHSARGTSCRSRVPNKGRAVVNGNYNRHV